MASSQGSTFLLSAADISWGRRECYTVLINDPAASLDGEYFTIDVPTTADFGSNKRYYVWFDLDSGSTDPNPGGDFTGNGIEIDVTTGQTAVDVALAMQTVLEAHADFRSALDAADSTGATVIVEAEFKGEVTNDAADVDSDVTITQQRDGLGGDLGRTTQDGVEITIESSSIDILTDQTGAIPQDRVGSGATASVTASFMEMTAARFKTIVGSVVGDSFTPSGGTELSGIGTSRLYASFFDLGGELVLHPTRLPASDRSQDVVLWKSAPEPGSLNFSGSEPQAMEVTFVGLADPDIQDTINLIAFGDHDQDVRA